MINGCIGNDIAEAMEMVLGSDLACDAVLHWREETKPEGWNDNDESSQVGTVVEDYDLEFRTLFHQVDHRLSGFQRFSEVQTGDVILDYLADLDLANPAKLDMRVEVAGAFYVQKNASAALKEAWDAYADHGGSMRTLLLTPAV